MDIREAIDAVVSGRSLGMDEAAAVMRQIMQGEATPAQLGSFLTALRLKGESTGRSPAWPPSCASSPSRCALKAR